MNKLQQSIIQELEEKWKTLEAQVDEWIVESIDITSLKYQEEWDDKFGEFKHFLLSSLKKYGESLLEEVKKHNKKETYKVIKKLGDINPA